MDTVKIKALAEFINEIEGKTIIFDHANWPNFQKVCVEWGNKIAPFLASEERAKFNKELERLSAPIHAPFLPSDESGAPKEGAFYKMKSIAKQRLHELEHGLSLNDKTEDAIHLPSKVNTIWLYKLLCRLSLGSIAILISMVIFIFTLGYNTAKQGWFDTLLHHNSQPPAETPLALDETGVFEGNSITTKDGRCTVRILAVNGSNISLTATVDANQAVVFNNCSTGARVSAKASDKVYYIDLHGTRGNIVDLAVYSHPK